MKIIFWMCLVSIVYTYLGYPILVWALARICPRPWRSAPILPSVSIVLAVHNGAELLRRKVEYLLHLDYPNLRDIIIVSDGSTDGTAKILADIQRPLLKAILLEEHGGKAVAVNAGLEAARGDIVLFLDIRPEIAAGAIQKLVSNFADPKIGCVAGELLLRQEGSDPATAAVGGLYWRYEQWIRKCESAIDSPVGVYGGFYAVRRELAAYQPAGMILDDMFQPLSIIRKGFRSVLDPGANVYDSWPKHSGTEFHRKVRTLAGNFQLLQLAPWIVTTQNRVVFQLLSHKVLRLFAPYLMIVVLLASFAVGGPYAVFGALQIFCLTLAVAGLRFRLPIFNVVCAPASALLILNTAAVVGFYKFLFTRGPLWKIWRTSTGTSIVPPDASSTSHQFGSLCGASSSPESKEEAFPAEVGS